jgi:hypothetical protein
VQALCKDSDVTLRPELPTDLVRLAALWPKIPAAVREGWLATAEALTRSKGNA